MSIFSFYFIVWTPEWTSVLLIRNILHIHRTNGLRIRVEYYNKFRPLSETKRAFKSLVASNFWIPEVCYTSRHLPRSSLNDHIHPFTSPELFINYHLYGWKPRPILTTALTKRPHGAHKSYPKLREWIWYRVCTNICALPTSRYSFHMESTHVRFARDPGKSLQRKKWKRKNKRKVLRTLLSIYKLYLKYT